MKINTLQFTICKYSCIMPCQSRLRHIQLHQHLYSPKAGSSDHNSLVKMFWDGFIQISSILHLMKWVMNENSTSWCLVFFPFKQMYTTKVRRNNICAAITFVELQGRTFFLFHNEFSTFNFFWALGFLNPPMANNSDVMLSFVIVFCFVNQFVWDKLFGLIY